ncbi:conserved unknown protein [Ectocarpus siliculosus]|uniref:Uncharacterized protein n=1 Tax=Ectocarpus siliculosus TaxID=2880 RepID=D7G7T9_ECTSI|nr:conserved unknown protein [Ectocarpus siliculosus]|eukprot:CBJ27820.1 conserved unknown protein [Ectocarpus siliculosus]
MANAEAGCVPEISKRLQEGWTLLNQHCPMPNCGTPLLRDHKKKVYCAKCKMYCITPEEAKSLGSPTCASPAGAGEGMATKSQDALGSDAATTGAVRGLSRGQDRQQPRAAPGPTKQQSRAAAEAAMGEKLLQGWTMLAEECETAGCCFPLMRDRGRVTRCVACDGNASAAAKDGLDDRVAAGQFEDPTSAAAPASTVSAPKPPSDSSSITAARTEPVMSEEQFAAVRKKRDALSASLGRYMLQGWSLSDKTCPREGCEPGTPLLKDRSTGVFYCAGCDTRGTCEGGVGGLVDESSTASGAKARLPLKRDSSGERSRGPPRVDEDGPGLPNPGSAKTKTPEVESEYEVAERARLRKQAAREQSRDGVSSATLAQRLLQGWAMLSTTCPAPECHNPLMRDRTGREQCVSCSRGSAPAAAGRQGTAAAGAAAATAPVQAAGDFAGEKETENDEEEDEAMLGDGAGRIYTERRMAEILAAPAAAAAPAETSRATTVRADGIPLDPSRVKDQALDTLYRALDLSQQRLRAGFSQSPLESSVDVDESMRQADLIAKLAVAARAVLDLPSEI